MFSVITAKAVARQIDGDLNACIDIIREAYLAHARGQTVAPPSSFLRFPDRPNARIISLPAHLQEPFRVAGLKWIASYPDNLGHGIPRASAVLILNRDDTGYPFACLEAAIISAARTAASAALGASLLTRRGRRARCMAIVGTGLIARYVHQFLMGAGWTVDRVQVFDTDAARARRFAERLSETARHDTVDVADNVESALRPADLVVFATTAPTPHVADPSLFAQRPVVLHISLRDLAPEVILSACNVVDDIDHVMRAETSVHLTEKLTGSRDFVAGTLADVIEKRCIPDDDRPIIFSPFGLGILDVALGKWVHDRAVAAGEAIGIEEFFGDFDRQHFV